MPLCVEHSELGQRESASDRWRINSSRQMDWFVYDVHLCCDLWICHHPIHSNDQKQARHQIGKNQEFTDSKDGFSVPGCFSSQLLGCCFCILGKRFTVDTLTYKPFESYNAFRLISYEINVSILSSQRNSRYNTFFEDSYLVLVLCRCKVHVCINV